MKNIIMCGGSGTRLWPISRKSYPKQFSDLGLEESLFRQTVRRNMDFCDEVAIVTNKTQRFLAVNQMEELLHDNYKMLLEPVGRNTAPAVTLACMLFDDDDIVLISASDHVISKQDEYLKSIKKAQDLAEKGYIVTFGIIPEHPETGYGYIEASGEDVISFKEKPDIETAKKYVSMGNYYWNSGMFMFKVKTFMNELSKFSNEVLVKCKKAMNKQGKIIEIDLDKMLDIPSISIDYAVMEHSDIIKVVPSDIGWSDLGSHESLYKNYKKDKDGNVSIGKVVETNSKNNLIFGSNRVIAAVDVNDLIIVDTEDALLVSSKGSSHLVNSLLGSLEEISPDITSNHKEINRPWGSYTLLNDGDRYKVKQVLIKPGKELSVHSHSNRSEHWTVVSGVAHAIVGEDDIIINHDETVFVARGTEHKLLNKSDEKLIIIETSVGEFLSEADIVRFDKVED